MKKLKTVKDLKNLIEKKHNYKSTEKFMEQLDIESKKGEYFDQDMINKIVLFKVNRYAEIPASVLSELNQINPKSRTINKKLSRSILNNLLMQKGVRLAMASTILRFKNPDVYQIIDQRVYRLIYGKKLSISSSKTEKQRNIQIDLYFDYLDKLKQLCKDYGYKFSDTDRTFFYADKKYNKDLKLDW